MERLMLQDVLLTDKLLLSMRSTVMRYAFRLVLF